MTNVLLIVNPVSGRQKAKEILYKIIDFLCRNNCKTIVFSTTGKGEATALVVAHGAGCDKIICCGGDGTLNEVFAGLASLELKVPVGYIPTGTSNDMARSLGLNQNTKRAIHTALNGIETDLDIGVFNEHYFSYVASFGAFTKASYETPQWLKNYMGRASYYLYSLSEIADIRPLAVKVVADGVEINGEFVFGSVSNSTVFGGMPIFADGSISLNDGKFEVILIKPVKGAKDLQSIFQGMFMQEYNEESVIFLTASQLTFSFDEDIPWTVDGEYAGDCREVNIRNLHRMVTVLALGHNKI